MDIATIVGVVLGFLVVVGSIVVGGGWQSFVHIPSLAITIEELVVSVVKSAVPSSLVLPIKSFI